MKKPRQLSKKKSSTLPDPFPLSVGELLAAIDRPRNQFEENGETVILFRPNHPGLHFVQIPKAKAKKALDEIIKKLPIVISGMDAFSECEKLLFLMFRNNAMNQ